MGMTTAARIDRLIARNPGSFALTHVAALDQDNWCDAAWEVVASVTESIASHSGVEPESGSHPCGS
jgi:hypothetical protein